jgi:hypothetical protein
VQNNEKSLLLPTARAIALESETRGHLLVQFLLATFHRMQVTNIIITRTSALFADDVKAQ